MRFLLNLLLAVNILYQKNALLCKTLFVINSVNFCSDGLTSEGTLETKLHNFVCDFLIYYFFILNAVTKVFFVI